MDTSTSDIELISAKTLVPLARRGLVTRTELLNRMAGAAAVPLMLVRSPAGYGKSTVLSQWARTNATRRFAWVSLDASENDPVVFWRYTLSAIRSQEPDFAPAAWESLWGPAPQVERTVLPAVLNGLVDIGPGLVVILDDYHRVTNPRVHDMVRSFIDYLPRSTQLVISSRTTPPLNLGRLRARGLIEEFGRTDLALSIDETSRLLTEQSGPLPTQDVATIHRRTEGWAAGVYLAARSQRSTGQQWSDAGAPTPIRGYIIQEFLGDMSDEERSFALTISLLDRMTGELCDHVTGRSDSSQRLAEGAQRNLLVIPLDGEGRWYRYHHMLQDVLRVELRRTRPNDVPNLHMRAHDWLVGHGFVSEAVDHAFAAGNIGAAAELVCGNALRYVASARLETVRQWMLRFDDEHRSAYPPLLVASAWTACFLGDDKATRRFATLAAAATYDGPPLDGMSSYEASVSVLLGSLAFEGVTNARDHAQIARNSEPLDSPRRPFVEAVFGVSSMAVGDLETAADSLSLAVHLEEAGSGELAYALSQLALVQALRGRVDEAARHVDEAIEQIDDLGMEDLAISCAAFAIAAWIAHHRDRDADARRFLRRATSAQHSLTSSLPFEAAEAHVLLAEVHLALGDHRSAATHAQAALARLEAIRDGGIFEARLRAVLAALDPALETATLDPGPDSLTTREQQILQLMPSGKTLREIADELYVSRNTAKTHASRIYKKLGVSSREAAVTRAIELQLI